VKRRFIQFVPILAVLAFAACSNGAMNQSFVPANNLPAFRGSGEVPFVGANPVRQLCPTPLTSDTMQCFALVRTDVMPALAQATSQATSDAESCPFTEGYCAVDLQEAYDLPSLKAGSGRVVAIVDAYGYHHAASDLAEYRKEMGLKACDTGTGCLRILNQDGHTLPLPGEPPPSDDWRGEDSLDLDMVSAICPNCKIVYIQANNDYTNNLYAGVKEAGALAKYVGLSWGGGPEGADNSVFHQTGHVIVAAAGDNGGGGRYHGGPIQPCTYTYVVCVGGTHLVRGGGKRGWSETVWNDWTFTQCNGPCGATGSACSTKISKPSWQTDKGCHMRSAADVSATASLRTPVIVYNSEIGAGPCPNDCFWLFGGTSASTQIIAGVYALAGNAATQNGASYLWSHHKGHINDVIHGNNLDAALGVNCASSVHYICTAVYGFDGPTGWGTPEGVGAF
jgi:subtilase family serine protease